MYHSQKKYNCGNKKDDNFKRMTQRIFNSLIIALSVGVINTTAIVFFMLMFFGAGNIAFAFAFVATVISICIGLSMKQRISEYAKISAEYERLLAEIDNMAQAISTNNWYFRSDTKNMDEASEIAMLKVNRIVDEIFNFMDNMPCIIGVFDGECRVTYVNKMAREQGFGLETVGCVVGSDRVLKNVKEVFETGIPTRYAETDTMPNGEVITEEYTFNLLHDLDGNKVGVALVNVDVGELEEKNRAKSRFLARMSHEIRTPISAVMGLSEIQLRNLSTEPHEIEDTFIKIFDSAKMLLRIVNDILDFSKVESGKMPLHNKEYDVASLVSDVAQLHMVYLDNKNVSFQMNVDENIPSALIGDQLRIKQIINNLLTNAFKYTAAGLITFSIQCEFENADCITLVFNVSDTGIGMTAEQIEDIKNLDNEYMRLHEKEKPFVSGTGLGMPIIYSLGNINK